MNTLPNHRPGRDRPGHDRPGRDRLALTLAMTIAVKCLLLYGLWYACFSHPQTRHMVLPDGQLERHLFSSQSNQQP